MNPHNLTKQHLDELDRLLERMLTLPSGDDPHVAMALPIASPAPVAPAATATARGIEPHDPQPSQPPRMTPTGQAVPKPVANPDPSDQTTVQSWRVEWPDGVTFSGPDPATLPRPKPEDPTVRPPNPFLAEAGLQRPSEPPTLQVLPPGRIESVSTVHEYGPAPVAPVVETPPAPASVSPRVATLVIARTPLGLPEPVASAAPSPSPATSPQTASRPLPPLKPSRWLPMSLWGFWLVTKLFDLLCLPFGPLLAWTRAGWGRNLLGATGVVMIAGAAVWAAVDYFRISIPSF